MSISATLARLKRGREAFAAAHSVSTGVRSPAASTDRLTDLEARFANPGNLRARCYVPDKLQQPPSLLVVLHGCTQNAAGYDYNSGWSRLADRHGFALLCPEQVRENNPNLCFNWYQAGDARRGRGEAASIANMIEAMGAAHGVDPGRVFVTGLSAGGAMAAVMMATYPELFAGGAIIAGMPFGCASNLSEAFELMAGRGTGDPARLADRVRAAGTHRGAWPRLSVWQGSADRIVAPANADALVAQWAGLHGTGRDPDLVQQVGAHQRRVWLDREGQEIIEQWDVRGMTHGTPLMPGTGEGQSGAAGAHMLDVGLSSTDRIAAFFGIGPEVASGPAKAPGAKARAVSAPAPRVAAAAGPRWPGEREAVAGGIQKTIEDALRSAGLMK